MMPGIFLGSRVSGSCIFWGSQYEAPSDPPVMYPASTPPPGRETSEPHADCVHYKSWTPHLALMIIIKECVNLVFAFGCKFNIQFQQKIVKQIGIFNPILSLIFEFSTLTPQRQQFKQMNDHRSNVLNLSS